MRKRLAWEFMVPTAAAAILGILGLGLIASHYLQKEVVNRADQEASMHIRATLDVLQTADDLSSSLVRSGMRVLQQEGARHGAPAISGSQDLDGRSVGSLRLGSTSQVGNFTLVDHVKVLTGCTATLFVKQGDDFVRVSTNVLKPDGSRAVGTTLDRQGRAYAAIQSGSSFYGVVDILGKPFMTAYEPMRDSSNRIVGVWYVGIPLTSVAGIGERVNGARILHNGFVALTHSDGRVIFKPEIVTDEQIQALAQSSSDKQWSVLNKSYDKWGYVVVAAYPKSDVAARLRAMQIALLACIVLVATIVVVAQYLLVTRIVLVPTRRLIERMRNADLNTTLREERQDEIGTLARVFAEFVGRIRETLVEVTHAAENLANASEVLNGTSQQITANSEEVSAQASTVANSAQQVSQNLQTFASGSEEMGASIKEIAKNANVAATVAKSAVGVAQSTTATISRLKDSSNQIGEVIKVINSIAEQTNLLALNATIEAARAGEAGKGFAVVANEVKELAKATANSTEDVNTKIEAIQADTKAVVEAIDSITGVIAQINEISGTIASAVEEQEATTNEMSRDVAHAASASDEITHNISGVAQAAKDTVRGAADTLQASRRLVETSNQLRKLIGGFNIDERSTSLVTDANASALTASAAAAR